MTPRFQPGDHLQVRRSPGYFHHGIYVSDDRVIQFGSAVTFSSKGDVGVNAVTLGDFEQDSTATVVEHGYGNLRWHPPADEPWKIVARAEFLLARQTRLPYNLIGHNCEVIANMCVSGGWTESYQTRNFFAMHGLIGAGTLIWTASRSRAKLPIPTWAILLIIAGVIAGLAANITYNDQIRRLWQQIRPDWQTHERMLSEDPRNEPGR